MFKLQAGSVNKWPRREANGLPVKVNFLHGSHKNGAASAESAEWIDDVERRDRRPTYLGQHRVEQHCVLVRQKCHAFRGGIVQARGQRSRAVSTRESATQDDDWKRIAFGRYARRMPVGHGFLLISW